MSTPLGQSYASFVVAICLVCLLHFGRAQNIAKSNDLACHDPDAGGTVQNLDRRFLIVGSDDSVGAGLGNLLIFFPAAYYFAAVTGRDIIISDRSTIGEMCRVVKCGFPLVSEMALAFPGILTEESVKNAKEVKKMDMIRHVEGGQSIDDLVVRAWGYKPETDWWVYFNQTVECVTKITQCEIADITCADRHAFQRLVRGPFISALTPKEEERIIGVSKSLKHSILSLPHSFAPRFDIAIHLRTQFQYFENQADVNSAEAKTEVQNWLKGEGKIVFEDMEKQVLAEIAQDRNHRNNGSMHHGILDATSGSGKDQDHHIDPVYVYLAADNEEVKEAFAQILEETHKNSTEKHVEIRVMRVKTNGIMHVKNLAKMKEFSDEEGVLDLVFDWYSLSLANTVLAWRKGGTHLISTFVHSAARLSGTPARTNIHKELGKGGLGTLGYSLQFNKHGHRNWHLFWNYGFLEDYRKPEDDHARRIRKLREEYDYANLL